MGYLSQGDMDFISDMFEEKGIKSRTVRRKNSWPSWEKRGGEGTDFVFITYDDIAAIEAKQAESSFAFGGSLENNPDSLVEAMNAQLTDPKAKFRRTNISTCADKN